MKCPKCNSVRIEVIDSRSSPGNTVRRRRVCAICGYRFTTYEMTEAEKGRLEKAERTAIGLMNGITGIIQEFG